MAYCISKQVHNWWCRTEPSCSLLLLLVQLLLLIHLCRFTYFTLWCSFSFSLSLVSLLLWLGRLGSCSTGIDSFFSLLSLILQSISTERQSSPCGSVTSESKGLLYSLPRTVIFHQFLEHLTLDSYCDLVTLPTSVHLLDIQQYNTCCSEVNTNVGYLIWICVEWHGVAISTSSCDSFPGKTPSHLPPAFRESRPVSFISPSPCCPSTSCYPLSSLTFLVLRSFLISLSE